MYCPKCNAYADDDSRFCAGCGAELEIKKETDEKEYDPQQSSPNLKNEYSYGDGNYQSGYSSGFDYNNSRYNYGDSNYNYGQSMKELSPHMNNTVSIIMLIVNIIIFNPIALVLSILSLVKYNDYEAQLRNGDFVLAEQYKKKSKKLIKAAAIFMILEIITAVLAAIVFVASGTRRYDIYEMSTDYFHDDYVSASTDFFDEDFTFPSEYFDEDLPNEISEIIGL